MNIIEELKQINVNLNFAVEFKDGLVVRSEIKKIDALIVMLSENLNGETLVSGESFCDVPDGEFRPCLKHWTKCENCSHYKKRNDTERT